MATPKKSGNGRTTPKKSVTSASAWKAKRKDETDLEVPSGNVCKVRRPQGMNAFMSNGVIPNALMPLVQEAIDGKQVDSEDLGKMLADPERLKSLFELVDHIVVQTVIEPVVVPCIDDDGKVIPESERDDDVLYVDEVDTEDKMFIFAFATGGPRDLATFREGQTQAVAAIPAKPGVSQQA